MSICKECYHNDVCKYGENRSNGMYCTGDKCKQYKSTADVVEVRHGKWLDQYEGSGLAKCSVCDYEFCDRIEGGNYCGNCGAKMDDERKENER